MEFLIIYFLIFYTQKDNYPVQYQNTLHFGLMPSRNGTVRTEATGKKEV